MTDSFGTNLESIPDALRVGGLSRVARKPQSTIASLRVQIAKPKSRTLRLEASDADRDHAVAHAFRGEIEHGCGSPGSELADGIDNPANRNRTSRGFRNQGIEDRVQIMLLPQNDTGGKRHFGVANVLCGQTLE